MLTKIKTLPQELQKVAEIELGEIPARIPDDLQALKIWIEQAPHLKARLDAQFLIQYLRGCKFSLEKTKSKIDLFFTLKTKFPILFNVTDINDPQFRTYFNYGFGLPLPRPLYDNGARIFFIKFEGPVAQGLVDIEQLFSVIDSMHEIMLMDDPYVGINGIIYLMDLKNISLNMISKFTPSFLKKAVQFYEKSLPFRIKSINIINTPGIFHSVLRILLPLFSEKIRQRITVYGDNYEGLRNIIPNQYLPIELGGENGCSAELVKDFEKKLLEYENYFKENMSYGTNELLRPGKPIDFESLYGLGGSFRKLEVD
ncbi:alpha-tocopherol transfer protein-like [Cochliomyia hominivorax]